MTEWDVTFQRSQEADDAVLAVGGEIDLAVAGQLALELEALVDDANGAALVDLSGITFIDSSGVRELLKAKRSAETRGGQLLLRNPSAPCRRVLEISGVWNEFSVQEAPT